MNAARRDRLKQSLDILVLLAALATIPLTLLELRGEATTTMLVADWAIWSVFAFEFALLLAVAPHRRVYLRGAWLSILVIVLSFPLLPHLLALSRLARLTRIVRLLRLLRLVVVGARAMRSLRLILARRGFVYILTITLLLIVTGGVILAAIEPETAKTGVGGGVWWAVVTATTVGYGDIAPTSFWGRGIAVVLMVSGIGLMSTLAASIAAYFVGNQETVDLIEVRERLDRIERALERLAAQGALADAPAPSDPPPTSAVEIGDNGSDRDA